MPPRAERANAPLVPAYNPRRVLLQAVAVVIFAVAASVISGRATRHITSQASARAVVAPPNSVVIDRVHHAVRTAFHNATDGYTPSSAPAPVFQIFDAGFLPILGPAPRIRVIAQDDTSHFAHEAPVWYPPTDELFFCSAAGTSTDANNVVYKLSLRAPAARPERVVADPPLEMANGATPYAGALLFATSGRGPTRAPALALVHPRAPHNATVLLNNFLGRQFNSLNDAKVHPASRAVFFTDTVYGHLGQFRPPPQVYRFEPRTGDVRVVADGFDKCNGLAFSRDGCTAYISDSGAGQGVLGYDATRPATVYAFDVEPRTQAFVNRRVFAHVDTGFPDGLAVDVAGNVYASTGSGVDVWNPLGILLGKVFIGSMSNNLAFAGKGRLAILAETKIYLVEFAAEGTSLEYWT